MQTPILQMETDGMISEIMRLVRQFHTSIHPTFLTSMDTILITMHGMML